jgi:hypothetical protein
MPRRRTSTKPPKERVKLRTIADIQRELARTHRLYVNKQITAAESARRVANLVAYRGGMANPVEEDTAYVPPAFNIFSVKAGDHVIAATADAPMRIVTEEEARQFYHPVPDPQPPEATPEPKPGAEVVSMRGPRRVHIDDGNDAA